MVHVLDTRQLGQTGIIAVTAVETSDGLVLFDTGPESTFETIAAELKTIGFAPKDVKHVFLSHIHFDHAGAAWRFAELGATIYVHPRGAPHLLHPGKLIESATRIFGENNMTKLWGRNAPVPGERLRILEDMDTVCVGGLEVRAIATPGHASHHHVYQWEENLFGGDVAGVRLDGGPPIPPFVPPELHVESWQDSIKKIRTLAPKKLYLPHFGLVTDAVSSHLDALEERVERWSIWFRDKIRAGANEQQLIPAFAQYEADDIRTAIQKDTSSNDKSPSPNADETTVAARIRDYEAADPSFMAVGAALRYWRKYHALAPA